MSFLTCERFGSTGLVSGYMAAYKYQEVDGDTADDPMQGKVRLGVTNRAGHSAPHRFFTPFPKRSSGKIRQSLEGHARDFAIVADTAAGDRLPAPF